METIEVKYFESVEGITSPDYAHKGDSGMDIRSSEEVVINPGETKLVKTGIKLGIPEGYEVQVRPRSGLSLKTNLCIANSPGTIDSSYTGEIGVIVRNLSQQYICDRDKNEIMEIDEVKKCEHTTYRIPKGYRIAQIVFVKVEKADLLEVKLEDDLNCTTRGSGGFGSTGIK